MRHLTASVPFFLAFTSLLDAQPAAAVPLVPPQVVQNASQSLALVLAGRPQSSSPVLLGPAIVVREDGVLLTSYHVVRDADSLQVRLNNGDVFNDAQLLGVDASRDVAAIKIGAVGLHTLPLAELAQARLGTPVVVIAHISGPSWNASLGQISAYRSEPAAAAPASLDALQFTPPLPRTSSGGVLLDRQGQALAFITSAQSPNAAVPIEKVINLAGAAPSRKFANGRTLVVPGAILASAQVVNQPQAVATPDAPEKSDALSSSADRDGLLRSVKTMYVDARGAKYFGSDQMKAALGKNKDFRNLNLRIVDDPKLADAVFVVGYTFAWDFPFELKHQNTSIVLVSGKGYGPFSGPLGAANVASEFVKAMKPYRSPAKDQK